MRVIQPSPFWINWLVAAAPGVVLFGLVLVLAPAFARQGFSLLVYSSTRAIDAFGPEPGRYISLDSPFEVPEVPAGTTPT